MLRLHFLHLDIIYNVAQFTLLWTSRNSDEVIGSVTVTQVLYRAQGVCMKTSYLSSTPSSRPSLPRLKPLWVKGTWQLIEENTVQSDETHIDLFGQNSKHYVSGAPGTAHHLPNTIPMVKRSHAMMRLSNRDRNTGQNWEQNQCIQIQKGLWRKPCNLRLVTTVNWSIQLRKRYSGSGVGFWLSLSGAATAQNNLIKTHYTTQVCEVIAGVWIFSEVTVHEK